MYEKWWDVEVVEFLDPLMALDGVESWAEIDEEESGEITWGFEVLKEGVEETCRCIFSPSLGFVSKLVRVQVWLDRWKYDVENQLF